VTDVIFEGERLLYEVSVPSLGGAMLRIYHHDPDEFALVDRGAQVEVGWNARDLLIFANPAR
jgi:putative spermidine/putrescine transport system ATP-binding protein